MKQKSITFTDEELMKCYNEKLTLHETATRLNATTVSVWRRAKKLGFKWCKLPKKHNGNKIELAEILEGKHPEYQTFKLHKRLIKEGIKEAKCDICGNTMWNNLPIPLQLDHIDGNPHNHKLENLRILCPNCHAQTETWCGKNK